MQSLKRRWIYYVATVLTGVLWYLAFLVGPGGVELMTKPYLLGGLVPFLCFPLTSAVLGAISRPIFERTSHWHAAITGVAMSLLGSILYVWMLFLIENAIDPQGDWARGELGLSGLIAITAIGPFMALQYGLVTLPAGIASGLFLRWASQRRIRPSPGPLGR